MEEFRVSSGVWDCFDAISITVQTKTLTRQNAKKTSLFLSKCVCAYTVYIHIYIYTHTCMPRDACVYTLGPRRGASPSFAFVRPRRAVSTLRRRGAVRRYSKLFTPAEYHFIYARARVCEMRVAQHRRAVILPFELDGRPFVRAVALRSFGRRRKVVSTTPIGKVTRHNYPHPP